MLKNINKILPIITLLQVGVVAAQDNLPADSISHAMDQAVTKPDTLKSLEQSVAALDTIPDSPLDTLQQKIESVTSMTEELTLDSPASDSTKFGQIKNTLSDPTASLDTLKPNQITTVQDTLKSKVEGVKEKVTHLQESVNSKPQAVMDSLDQRLQNGMDKLTIKELDTLKSNVSDKVADIKSKQQEQQQKMKDATDLNKSLSELTEGEVPDDLKGVQPEAQSLPTADIPDGSGVDLPDQEVNLPTDELKGIGVEELELDTEALNMDLPQAGELGKDMLPGELNMDVKDININEGVKDLTDVDIDTDIKSEVGNIGEYTEKPLEKLDMEELDEVKDQMGNAGEISGQVGEYSEDLNAVKEGDFSSVETKLEDRFENMEEFHKLKEQEAILAEWRNQEALAVKNYKKYQDKEALLAEVKARGKAMAVDHFAGHQDKLIEAHQRLAQLKQQYTYVSKVKGQPNEKIDRLKSRPFIDRIVLGFDLELGKLPESNAMDFAPYAGYKFNDKWSIYAGYVWKYALTDGKPMISRTNISGYRGGVHYHLLKGFSVVGLFERLEQKVFIDDQLKTTEHTGVMLGLSKKYKIAGWFYGQGQILFNVAYDNRGPYEKPFNLRMGFFFNKTSAEKEKKD